MDAMSGLASALMVGLLRASHHVHMSGTKAWWFGLIFHADLDLHYAGK